MGVEYRVLGPLEAIVGGRSVELGAPRHRALLALLLAQANTVVPVHRLIDEIWGDAPPASAANLVQGAVSHLRKVLGKDSIVTRGHGYAVQVARMPSTFTSSSAARRRAVSSSSEEISSRRRRLWRRRSVCGPARLSPISTASPACTR